MGTGLRGRARKLKRTRESERARDYYGVMLRRQHFSMWKGVASTALGQISMVSLDGRQVWLLNSFFFNTDAKRTTIKKKTLTWGEETLSESSKVHPWNKRDLCWCHEKCEKGKL